MRGLEDIAARIEDDVGRPLSLAFGLPSDPSQCLWWQLQAGENSHPPAHRLEALPPAPVERRLTALPPGKAARQLHHEPGVDRLGAGGDTLAAAAAYRSPARRLRGAGAADNQIDYASRGSFRIRVSEARRRDHRTGPETRAATRAGLRDRLGSPSEIFQIFGCAVDAAHSGITSSVSIFWLSSTTRRSMKQ